MKFSFHLITLVSVALCGIVHAAPAPLCDRTNGLCGDIAARDVADSMMADDLVARAAKKAANAKIQRQAAPKVERKVKAFTKQANKTPAPAAKVKAQANKLRQSEKGRVATQARKDNKAAKKQAWAAAGNRATTTKNIQAVQKKQGQKPQKKAAKQAANNKIQQKAAAGINTKVKNWREKEKAAGGYMPRVNILADKMRGKEKERALTQARKDRKADRGKQWGAKANSPAQKAATKAAAAGRRQERQRNGAPSPANQAKLAKNVKPTKQEKKNVKDRFQAARQKYGQTQGMPGRGQTATVGPNSASGREVRNSVFNSYLHQKNPIGMQRLPKKFNNDPYSPTHGTLANQRPLPATARKLKEYPVIKGSPNGWTGNGPVGALRTVTYKNGGRRNAAVIGHDTSPARGGNADDHYVATVTRELESDMEDFE
ncbi:hypothetical protein MD484_g7957, partial [Candolleomyces efflorescens]